MSLFCVNAEKITHACCCNINCGSEFLKQIKLDVHGFFYTNPSKERVNEHITLVLAREGNSASGFKVGKLMLIM